MKRMAWTVLLVKLICVCMFSSCNGGDGIPDHGSGTHQATDRIADSITGGAESDTGGVEGTNSAEAAVVCQHTFGEWNIVKQATCKEEGKRSRACGKCSVTEEEAIPKNEVHTPVTDAAVSASCQNTGLTEGSHCGVCGKILVKQDGLSKQPHNYVDGYCDVCKERKASSGLAFIDYNDDGYAAVSGIGSCTDTVIVIPELAPSGLPVKEISMQAFQGCTDLVEISIPDAVGYIGMEAFMNCTSLKKISLPDAYTDMALRTFQNCTSLKEITVPGKVFRIGPECFSGCTALESIVIPASVTTYSKNAFQGCTIKNVYISSLDAWCTGTFYNAYANPLYCAENLYLQQELVTSVELNKDVSFRAFAGYQRLTEVVLGNSVESVGESAFYGCGELTRVVFGNRVATVGACSFYNCTKLNEICLPASVKTISNKAFYGCSALQTVTGAGGLQSLGDYAFSGCSALRAIDLPETVTYMGISAFEKCASLESITIPFVGVGSRGDRYQSFGSLFGSTEYEGGETVTQFKGYSYCIPKSLKHVKLLTNEYASDKEFENCKYIERITFGKNIKSVGASSVTGCSALTDIYYEGTKAEWEGLHYSESFNSLEAVTVTCADGVVEKN